MLDTILALIAAMITIFIAGLLVKKQQRCHAKEQALKKQIENNLESIVNEVENLTGGETIETSLIYLEKRITRLTDSIALTKAISNRDSEYERRKNKRAKTKKHFTDD